MPLEKPAGNCPFCSSPLVRRLTRAEGKELPFTLRRPWACESCHVLFTRPSGLPMRAAGVLIGLGGIGTGLFYLWYSWLALSDFAEPRPILAAFRLLGGLCTASFGVSILATSIRARKPQRLPGLPART